MKSRPWVLTACAIVTLLWPCAADAQEGGAGYVEELRGTTFLRQHSRARPERLNSTFDVARRLYPGQQVRCARGSILRIRLGQELRTIRPVAWFTIPRVASSRSNPIRRMIDAYGRRGGRARTGAVQVFSPSDHSVVLIEQFVVRWVQSAAGCTFSILIRDVAGNRVWRKEGVDGASGSLDDASARKALAEYRARSRPGPLTLVVDDSCGSTTLLSFSLLSAEGERSLKEDLAFWDEQPGMFASHLGRASVYDRYRMFPQAADEYEAALREAPGSRHLLIRAITAHGVTGNLARATDLIKRLPPGTPLPW